MPLQYFDLDDGLGMFVLAEVFVDSDRGAFAIAHTINNQARAEDAIAAGKDALRGGHQCLCIDGNQSAAGNLHAVFRLEEIEPGRLANGHDDGVALHLAFAAFEERRIETFVLIEDPFGFERLQCNHLAVLANHPLGAQTRVHTDAFLFGFLNFFESGRHLVARLKTHQVYFPCAHAQSRKRNVDHLFCGDCGHVLRRRLVILHSARMLTHYFARGRAGYVHGHVAATNHDHFLADREFVA